MMNGIEIKIRDTAIIIGAAVVNTRVHLPGDTRGLCLAVVDQARCRTSARTSTQTRV